MPSPEPPFLLLLLPTHTKHTAMKAALNAKEGRKDDIAVVDIDSSPVRPQQPAPLSGTRYSERQRKRDQDRVLGAIHLARPSDSSEEEDKVWLVPAGGMCTSSSPASLSEAGQQTQEKAMAARNFARDGLGPCEGGAAIFHIYICIQCGDA